jgi:hypothetical protein
MHPQGITKTYLDDLINQLGVQHARHKPGANALDLVRARLPA